MKRYTIILTIIVLSISGLRAQVNREVEVTKAYIPTVERATKPLLEAIIADTAYINPEVDYTITPLSINTPLQTQPINPATVTYWEFNRPATSQLKVGAGYPLNTLLEGYASTHNASVGYLAGSIRHKGDYSKIENELMEKVNATEILNDVDLAAGLYIAGRTLRSGLSYSNDSYRNYAFEQLSSPNINFQKIAGSLGYGDDFVDLRELNYSVAGGYSHFYDCRSNVNNELEIRGDLGKEITLGELLFSVGYNAISSGDDYANKLFSLSASLNKKLNDWQLKFGVDYAFDKTTMLDQASPYHHFMPQLSIYQLSAKAISPFVALGGSVTPNNYARLSGVNPYITAGSAAASSAEYYFKGGIMGQNSSSTLSYRLFAAHTIGTNSHFWALDLIGSGEDISQSSFDLGVSDLTTTSLNFEMNYSPLTNLMLVLDSHYYFYHQSEEFEYLNSRPNFDASLGAEYTSRRFRMGVKATVMSDRSYTVRYFASSSSLSPYNEQIAELPAVVDLSAHLNWQANEKFSIFIEGDNLCGSDLYPWPMYRGFGARVTAGVKINFR